jgi:hypothetical protein
LVCNRDRSAFPVSTGRPWDDRWVRDRDARAEQKFLVGDSGSSGHVCSPGATRWLFRRHAESFQTWRRTSCTRALLRNHGKGTISKRHGEYEQQFFSVMVGFGWVLRTALWSEQEWRRRQRHTGHDGGADICHMVSSGAQQCTYIARQVAITRLESS